MPAGGVKARLSLVKNGNLDLSAAMDIIGFCYGGILLVLLICNLVYAHSFALQPSSWEEIVGSLEPILASTSSALPNVESIAKDLLANDLPERAALVLRVYPANWLVIAAASLLFLPLMVLLCIRAAKAPLIIRRVRFAWFSWAGSEAGNALRLALSNLWLGWVLGVSVLLFVSLERVAFDGYWAGNTVHQSDFQLVRFAFFWVAGVIGLMWGMLWSVLFWRIRTRGLEGIHWRD